MPRPSCSLLACVALAACGDSLTLPSQAMPGAVTVVRGDAQVGTVGEPLADSVVVRVLDLEDRPLAGQPVAFVPLPDDALASPDTVLTDAAGRAAARWVLGTAAGEQRLEARIESPVASGGLVATVTASARAGPPEVFIEAGGQDQSAVPGTALPQPLVVRVEDRYGNPVEGTQVNWAVTRGGGFVSEPRTVTDAAGLTSVRWTLGVFGRRQTVEAALEADPGRTVTFTATARPYP
ncbi:MAG TPA: Ig-like domain-containing protein [Gemmatimonadales bacterium]|nr:Ig-like domain-containing protein [Gemmatimonadales bacterium]